MSLQGHRASPTKKYSVHRLSSSKKKAKREIHNCIQEDQQLDKSKEKNEKIKERLVSKTTQNEIHKFLSKLKQSENIPHCTKNEVFH